jgi:hypothetical protein
VVGFPNLGRHPGEDLDRNGSIYRVFLDRISGHGVFGQSQCGGFVTQAHIGQREIVNEDIIFRLFFEERFQFAARLSPAFLGGGTDRRRLLAPSLTKSAVRHCKNPTLDQAWQLFPCAEAIRARDIFQITTSLPGHQPDHDDALARLNRLLRQ